MNNKVLRLLPVQRVWSHLELRALLMLSRSESLSLELTNAECRLWALSGFSEAPRVGTLRAQNPLDTNLPHDNRKAGSEVWAKGEQLVTLLSTLLPQAPTVPTWRTASAAGTTSVTPCPCVW